ncbi:MAG: diaminopropionate ammonia-lyase [Desulfovibrionaceae bacterium]|nr:diaminopropionate ammonia-lyase [Desulfovibrionaceae bacterium]
MRLQFLSRTPDKTPSKLLDELSQDVAIDTARFHASMPGYKATPIISLDNLARALGLKNIWIKDESCRFNLGAFKVLGASFAIARQLAIRIGIEGTELPPFEELAKKAGKAKLRFVTASDGNHGYAVAWTCRLFGLEATVILPKGNAEQRAARIRSLGAHVEIADGNYDEAVAAAEKRSRLEGSVLVQDTAWDGYEEIPLDIMRGYCTIEREISHEIVLDLVHQIQHKTASSALMAPTHVFLQAGVGSFASAMAACQSSSFPEASFFVVEPCKTDCLFQTAKADDGKLHSIEHPEESCMTSLCCGTPSSQAWEILRRTACGFVSCDDVLAEEGQKILQHPLGSDPKVTAGLSGAVTTGVLHAICHDEDLRDIRDKIGLDASSRVLLINTEGDVDSLA